MHLHLRALCCALAVACGTSTSQPAPASGSTNPTFDAGTVATPADGGTTGGGAIDAGTATANDCDGLMPGPLPAMVQYQTTVDYGMPHMDCRLPIGEGGGHVALDVAARGQPTWTVLDSSGKKTGSFTAGNGEAWGNQLGFVLWAGPNRSFGPPGQPQMTSVAGYDSTGSRLIAQTAVTASTAVFAPNPRGGLLAVGRLSVGGSAADHQMAMMFDAGGGILWGPVELPSDAAVFGLGVDEQGQSLIIFDGGSGNVDAVWLRGNGAAPDGSFRLITGFQAGASTWFETSPLIDSGLAIRRMDGAANTEIRTSQWLLVLKNESKTPQDAPDWLKQRPNTDLQLARSGRAYAAVPWAANANRCDQQVEILSPTGVSCGKVDFAVDQNACQTRPLRLGPDGTVMQMLPTSREQLLMPPVYTCTLRYWPAALH